MDHWLLWTIFGVVLVVMMALDLGVFHRQAHEVSVKESLIWTAVWIVLALAFNVLVYFSDGGQVAVEFLTCYLTEKALSVDNIFVFLVIFTYFGIPAESQHRVLFWGILGALAMRAIFLLLGVALIEKFHWTIYVLGGILVLTGLKLLFQKEGDMKPEKNIVLRLARRFLPVTQHYEGSRFFVVRDGRRVATPLFLALLVVETTDVLFAVDSVPAALGISQDMFVLYTSNVFAIMGLRSLFFAVAGLLRYLHYLKYGLAIILVFIGVKMLIAEKYKMPVQHALGTVAGILLVAIVASLIRTKLVRSQPEEHS